MLYYVMQIEGTNSGHEHLTFDITRNWTQASLT